MLIRYPGSKTKHVKHLQDYFPTEPFSLCEPMVGAGALSFHLLKQERLTSLHLNDFDAGIVGLWQVVRDDPGALVEKVNAFIPSVEGFRWWKEHVPQTPLEHGFRKIVLHQLSWSGLGETAGGPLGGWTQTGNYKVDSCWSSPTLTKNINKAHLLLTSVPTEITHGDCFDVFDSKEWLYLDPPYYKTGGKLYVFGEFDHPRLSRELANRTNWVLSYDNVPEVHDLYHWGQIESVEVTSHMCHREIKDLIVREASQEESLAA